MTMRPLAVLLLAAALASQTPQPAPPAATTAPKEPTFHLPAGTYSVAELLQQAGQAIGRPIAAPPQPAEMPLRLQHALALPRQAWEDVLGALLATRGLALVRTAEGGGHEVLPAPTGMEDWVSARAVSMTPQQVFERSAFAGPVDVLAATTTPTAMLLNVLRPHFPPAGAGPRAPIAFKPVEGGLRLIGMAATVRSALQTIASQAPDLAAALPLAPPPWPRAAPRGTHRLEQGSHLVADVLDRLAAATGRNVVESEPLVGVKVGFSVPATIEGDALQFEERVTALLWAQLRIVVVCISDEQRLDLAVRLLAPGKWPDPASVREVRAAELLARPELVAWVATVPDLGALTQRDVFTVFRGAAGLAPGSSLTLTTMPGGCRICGLSTDVARLLKELEEMKKAGK
jgi:hypothetical protein